MDFAGRFPACSLVYMACLNFGYLILLRLDLSSVPSLLKLVVAACDYTIPVSSPCKWTIVCGSYKVIYHSLWL
jgi:hypothetical protein